MNYFHSSLPGHETYVVLINFGATEQRVNVYDLVKDIGMHCEVVMSGSNTFQYTAG